MPTAITTDLNRPVPDIELLRLFQLASPALPVGAFAFSQGMESAVERGLLKCEADVQKWLSGLLQNALARIDAPVLYRLHQCWIDSDPGGVSFWNRRLCAMRGCREFQSEDLHMGQAMARLITQLEIAPAQIIPDGPLTFAAMFCLAATRFQISPDRTAAAYLWAWLENQTAAAVKLVPLGQTAGQRILLKVSEDFSQTLFTAKSLADEDIGSATFGLSLLGTFHETQHTRLFRS